MSSLCIQLNPKPHEPPFVLAAGDKIIKEVFEFLRLLYLRGVSRQTIRAYSFDLLSFYRFMEEKNLSPDILQSSHFTDFVLSQRKENAAPRSINRRLVVARSFLNFCSEGWGDKLFNKTCAPFYKGMKNKALLGKSFVKGKGKGFSVKVPSVLITPLAPAEIKRFLLGLRKYRDQAMVCLMIFCGLRTCEVLSLDVNDIDFIDNQLRVRGKGLKERLLPMPSSVRQNLQRYLDYERPDSDHTRCFVVLKGKNKGQPLSPAGLFTLFRHRRQTIPSLKGANPHRFRHTFCTNMIRQNVSLPVVQKLMGHADIEVTMGYVHLSLTDIWKEYHRAITSLQESVNMDGPKEDRTK